jgi:uncharacterized protein YecA (UPF0149 family)
MYKHKVNHRYFESKLRPFAHDWTPKKRNEKCPCGSGIKFKKCCIDKK